MLTGPSESPGPPEDQKAGGGRWLSDSLASASGLHPRPPSPAGRAEAAGQGSEERRWGRGSWVPHSSTEAPPPRSRPACSAPPSAPPRPPAPPPPPTRPPGPLGSAVHCGLGATPSPTPAVQSGECTGHPQASSDACTRGKQLALGCRGCPSQQRTGSFSGVWWGGLGGGPRSPQGRVLGEGERGALGCLSPGGDGPLSCPVPGPRPPGEADRVLGRVTTA